MPRAKGELYLVDKDNFEYGFNADMAKHTSLYAVMRDGVRVPWTGSPPVQGGPVTQVVLADDKFPTEAELLQAKAMAARAGQDRQSEQVAMAAQARQSGQGMTTPVVPRMPQAGSSVEGNEVDEVAADLAVQGKTEPPSTAGGIHDYKSDQPVRLPAPPPPPVPPRRAPPRPPIRP